MFKQPEIIKLVAETAIYCSFYFYTYVHILETYVFSNWYNQTGSLESKYIISKCLERGGIFHPWGHDSPGDWWDFSIGEKHFQFSSWDHVITEWAKDKLCNKMIETWKLKIHRANWNVELKSPGMEHGFLSQNQLYFVLKTKRASQISFHICEN